MNCPKCKSESAEFVRFITWNGNMSNEAEVKVWRCGNGHKYIEATSFKKAVRK